MRALFVTTSSDRLPSGHPTGLWVEEFAVPYMAAVGAGADVLVASPKGGAVPLDAKSAPTESDKEKWGPALSALRTSVNLASVQDEVFDLIFIPGGHGPMVDLAHDKILHHMLARHDASGKLIAAVCHGPAALVHVGADPNLSHRADPILSQGRKPAIESLAVDKCRSLPGSLTSSALC